MIRLEIVERKGAKLYKKLIDAMRSGDLRTFVVTDRGKKVTHVRHPGLMRWKESDGVITGTLRGTKGENAWQLLGAFLGRLAHKYADRVESIEIRFMETVKAKRPARKAARRPARKAAKRSR
jgi:hypothetical protein